MHKGNKESYNKHIEDLNIKLYNSEKNKKKIEKAFDNYKFAIQDKINNSNDLCNNIEEQ